MAWLHFYEMSRIVQKFTETENEEKTPHSLGSARWIKKKKYEHSEVLKMMYNYFGDIVYICRYEYV